jgi:hypothetical protein
MSIHVSGGHGIRRVVLSCDAAGCPVQVEPPPIESWRSDSDARVWARDHAVGWTLDLVRQTDYCPEHASLSVAPAAGVIPPRPTAAARDESGNPLNRDEYAVLLRARLTGEDASAGATPTAARMAVAASLLDELAAVYRGEDLGELAHDVSLLLEAE